MSVFWMKNAYNVMRDRIECRMKYKYSDMGNVGIINCICMTLEVAHLERSDDVFRCILPCHSTSTLSA